MVQLIALRLGLFVDDDEANVPEQEIQHGGRSPESEDHSFSDDSVHKGQDSRRKRKVAACDQDEHEEDNGPSSKLRKLTKIMMDSLLIVTLILDLQRSTLEDGM